ncbi:MAG: hypothetical protein AVDCRST_MAG67-2371, partial [uncultured Solirubrobacteraceae bacterium]
ARQPQLPPAAHPLAAPSGEPRSDENRPSRGRRGGVGRGRAVLGSARSRGGAPSPAAARGPLTTGRPAVPLAMGRGV